MSINLVGDSSSIRFHNTGRTIAYDQNDAFKNEASTAKEYVAEG